MSDHPQYRCNTIMEALCELRIELSPDSPWKPTLPGAVFDQLKDTFPQFEPVAEFGVEVSVGPQGPVQRLIQAPVKYRFSDPEGSRIIQLSSSVCVFNVLKPYTSWRDMKDMIMNYWPVIRGVVCPAAISQIGLRYINKIPATQGDRLGDWLGTTKYLSEGVVGSLSPVTARIEARPDLEHGISITVSNADLDPSTSSSNIIYDIDCMRLGRVAGEVSYIDYEIEELHERVWLEFSSAKTDRLDKLLMGEGA